MEEIKVKVNDEHKDRLFKHLFGSNEHRQWTLELYNAVNGSDYTNPEDITITTVEDALYLSMKNDVSFLIADTMSFYEHQSTYNPNMPVRMLMYAGMVYSRFIETNEIYVYGSTLKSLPVPKLVTFYNGTRDTDDRIVLRLSDSFPAGSVPDIEISVLMLNINYGRNAELQHRCRPLMDYSQFVESVRELRGRGSDMEDAVHIAIRRLEEDSPIRGYLLSKEAEVYRLCITEYDEKKDRELFRKDCLEEGRAEGLAMGADRMASLVEMLLKAGRTDDLQKASTDPVYRENLFKEFGID